MDETTNVAQPPRTAPRLPRTGTDDVEHVADQPALPLGLTFDDGVDEPIGYTLTARARRQVAPDALPSLRVVEPYGRGDEPDGDLERPGDTRPSRARALRRAGVTPAEIAGQLEVDELVVRAWIGDVAVARRRTGVAGRPSVDAVPAGRVVDAGEVAAKAGRSDEHERRRAAFQLARAAAAEEGRSRLDDAAFVAGLGLVSGILSVDDHAATLTTARIEIAGRALRWLAEQAGLDTSRVRVVLRLGPDVAGDLARHRWATALGLPTGQVLHARWRGAPTGDAVEALVRLADPTAAATLAGWRDALLAGPADADAEDAGF